MNFLQMLLNIPAYLLMVLLICFFAGLNILITYLIRKYLLAKIGHIITNEITGYIFSVVAGFYASISQPLMPLTGFLN